MKKINIIKENTDYYRIIKNNKPFKYKEYSIFLEKNNDNKYYQFGFSVSKKICNAVNRNKIKRRLKDIIDKKDYKNNFNCIIIVRKSILNKTYQEITNQLFEIVEQQKLIKKEK